LVNRPVNFRLGTKEILTEFKTMRKQNRAVSKEKPEVLQPEGLAPPEPLAPTSAIRFPPMVV
jgi:hypothetical protein